MLDEGSVVGKSRDELAIGWNVRSWRKPILEAIQCIRKYKSLENISVLEIGSGRYSTLSLYFDNGRNQLLVTAYGEEESEHVKQRIRYLKSKSLVSSDVQVQRCGVDDVAGTFDLIIMKSVLGGIIRTTNEDSVGTINSIIQRLVSNNLEKDGVLLTCDNGASFFEPFISKVGARRNSWTFLRASDFKRFESQFVFGFFSAFSIRTRFPRIGALIEDYLVYPLDCLFALLGIVTFPTVIVSLYRKKD